MLLHRALPFFVLLAACGRPLGVPEPVEGTTTMPAAGQGAPGNATACGNMSGFCRRDQFCELEPGCGAGAVGTCAERPDDCTGANSKQPSCGCDHVTYVNDCLRQQAGVSLAHAGECPHPLPRDCIYPTKAICEANNCRWFVCPPNADCVQEEECIPDCRRNGCDATQYCTTCETASEVYWTCLPNDTAC
jgi:hypothetical protein